MQWAELLSSAIQASTQDERGSQVRGVSHAQALQEEVTHDARSAAVRRCHEALDTLTNAETRRPQSALRLKSLTGDRRERREPHVPHDFSLF